MEGLCEAARGQATGPNMSPFENQSQGDATDRPPQVCACVCACVCVCLCTSDVGLSPPIRVY